MDTMVKSEVFSLRAWLDRVKAVGQLKQLEGVDLKYELGAITELNAKVNGAALLFDGFKGHAKGFRVLTSSMMNAKTLGATMGFEGDFDNMQAVDKVADILRGVEAKYDHYPVEYVDDGPVMENRQTGDKVDLTIFPTPLWHEMDGGPFIGTGVCQVHVDPETGWTNLGTYRNQLIAKDRLGNYISPGHHGNIIRQKYWSMGKPCPVVLCFGQHPLFLLLASSDVPAGQDEMRWAGAILGSRVPVIKGPLTGLPIPADAEIAVEGYAYPNETVIEGPLGEFTGYYAGGQKSEPAIRVEAVYYRNNPILLGSPPCRPPDDFSYQSTVMRSAYVKEALRRAGIPAIKSVWVSEMGGSRMWIVTSLSQKYAGHAAQAARVAANCQAGGLMARYSIVVDDDIDPSNNADVIWALSTRSEPAQDIDILRQSWSNPLDPTLSEQDKERRELYNSQAIINACRPFHRLKTFAAVAEATPELQASTKKKWAWVFEK